MLAISLLLATKSHAQSTVPIRGDTIKVFKNGGTATLLIVGNIVDKNLPTTDTVTHVVGITTNGLFTFTTKGIVVETDPLSIHKSGLNTLTGNDTIDVTTNKKFVITNATSGKRFFHIDPTFGVVKVGDLDQSSFVKSNIEMSSFDRWMKFNVAETMPIYLEEARYHLIGYDLGTGLISGNDIFNTDTSTVIRGKAGAQAGHFANFSSRHFQFTNRIMMKAIDTLPADSPESFYGFLYAPQINGTANGVNYSFGHLYWQYGGSIWDLTAGSTTTGSASGLQTANNGLTANTATNVQLGGALTGNTTISGSSKLIVTSSIAGADATLEIANTGTGKGIAVTSVDDVGVHITTTNSFAISANSTNTDAISASTQSGKPIIGTINAGSNNGINTNLSLVKAASSPADGIGQSVDFYISNTTGGANLANQIISRWSTAALASRTSELSFVGVNSATTRTLAVLDGAGIFTLGVAGTNIGKLALSGNTSGTITIQPQAAAGTYNFNLPTTAGSSGDFLISGGGGSTAMTWSNPFTTVYSGTFSPTVSNDVNLDSYTENDVQYMRLNDVITVSGSIVVDPNTANTNTSFEMDLPTAPGVSFSNEFEAGGTGAYGESGKIEVVEISAVASSTTVLFKFEAKETSSHTIHFHFTYKHKQ